MPTEIERLYREHRAGLVRLVERELHDRHDAEDVVQTAFLDAQCALERGTIPRNPRAWLAAIALNAGRHLRRRRLNAEPLEDYAVQEASRVPEIRAALASLPTEQRAAVVYRDVLGLSYGETAEQMGKSVNAVTMLLHRGRGRLRQALGVTAGGIGLWRWLRRAGMPQATVAKSTGAVVVAAGLATTGVVAARVIAPMGTDMKAAAPATHSGGLVERAGGLPSGMPARDLTRRHLEVGSSSVSAIPAAMTGSGVATESAASISSTAAAASSSPSTSRAPTVSLPKLPTITSPVTVAAQLPVSTPITTVTVTIPTSTTATVTTPIATVTLPIP